MTSLQNQILFIALMATGGAVIKPVVELYEKQEKTSKKS